MRITFKNVLSKFLIFKFLIIKICTYNICLNIIKYYFFLLFSNTFLFCLFQIYSKYIAILTHEV